MSKFTKQAIMNSFVKILNEKPMDKITVKDIIDDCEINRSTFYYHFENVYACLVCVLETEGERLAKTHTDYTDWVEGIMEAMAFAVENKRAVFHIYKSVNRDELENYLSLVFDTVLRKHMQKALKEIAADYDLPQKDIELIIDMYKHGMTGLLFKWLKDGMPGEPIEDFKKIGKMMEGNLHNMVENIANV